MNADNSTVNVTEESRAQRPPIGTGPRKRSPPRRVVVSRVQAMTPAMRRVTFTGSELLGFATNSPASYIKLIFPEPGQAEPTRPTGDGPRSTTMRTYTPEAVRADPPEVDVDFVLHGEGPAATWAAQAAVGQVLFMGGPGPGYAVDRDAVNHLLIADDSALPAVETILADLPASARVSVLVEVIGAAEARPLASAAQVSVQWLPRGSDHRLAGQPIEGALRAMPTIALDAKIYIACEAAAMRRIRTFLCDERGIDRSQIVGRGYWKLDAINHPDHDYGDDR